MTTFRIISHAGMDMGNWEGSSAAEALAALHRDAGYACQVEDGRLVFADPEDAALCGQVEDWIIREAEEGELDD